MPATDADLKAFARRALGYPSNNNIDGGHLDALIESMIDKAFTMVWLPPTMPGENMGHQWSFRKAEGVFYTRAPYSTGTISIAADAPTTVTGSGTSFPANGITDGSLLVNDQLFEINARDSATQLTLASGPITAITDASYKIIYINYSTSTGAGNLGPITYAPNFGDGPIKIVADTIIDDLRQANVPNSGRPEYASVSGDTIKLWPVPDAEYQLRYQYLLDVNSAQDASSPLPSYTDDCVYAAMSVCIAEHLQSGDVASSRAYFLERMRHAVAADKAIKGLEYGDFLGYNGDRSDGLYRTQRPRLYTSDVTVYQNNRTSL
tara:strand:- start:529 stop:1488 length:960 start_codon:yes stop_codon:yes gene_type:complete